MIGKMLGFYQEKLKYIMSCKRKDIKFHSSPMEINQNINTKSNLMESIFIVTILAYHKNGMNLYCFLFIEKYFKIVI